MGEPPLRFAVQVMDSSAVGDEGEQLMLSITGAWTAASATTVRVTEAVSLPAALVTVSEMVLAPVELKLVLYVAMLLPTGPPRHE